MKYWNALTYCTKPSCLNEARYCYINDGIIYFICKECRRAQE